MRHQAKLMAALSFCAMLFIPHVGAAGSGAIPAGWETAAWEGVRISYPLWDGNGYNYPIVGYRFRVAANTGSTGNGTLKARASSYLDPCPADANECNGLVVFNIFPSGGLTPRDWVARYAASSTNRNFRDVALGGRQGVAYNDAGGQNPNATVYVIPLPNATELLTIGVRSPTALTDQILAVLAFEEKQCFPETGKCITGRFQQYWQQHGGLAINGFPISDEMTQTLEDGKPYTVQYFERVRMEYHPEESDPAYQVQLGQFGRKFHPAGPPVAPQPGATFFPQTGHNVSGGFFTYWQANGALAQFGFPLSEVFRERLEDGQEYEVQYFERARFEYHQDAQGQTIVLLGQFGRRVLENR